MASTQARPARKSYRRQALMWLMMTLVLGVVTALVWMFSQTPAMGSRIENAPLSTPQVSVGELKQPLSIESLRELDTDVQPIDFEATIRDLRNYPDEFKDKRYLLANKGKWTVQVMNVAENEVIVSYLEGRKDCNKFAYFRYRDENKQLRYMLTYGVMSSPQEAVGAAKLVDFGLPADVRVLPEEINRYVSIIDNYERPEPIKDLSTRRARSVRLQPTKREVPMRNQAESSEDTTNNNTGAADERNNANSSDQSGSAESIRQSADTSATLSVNEARTLETEDGVISVTPDKDNQSPTTKDESKKLPVVPTPKPPSSSNEKPNSSNGNNTSGTSNNSNNNNNSSSNNNNANTANNSNKTAPNNKPANSGAAKNNDSIKTLIEEKNE